MGIGDGKIDVNPVDRNSANRVAADKSDALPQCCLEFPACAFSIATLQSDDRFGGLQKGTRKVAQGITLGSVQKVTRPADIAIQSHDACGDVYQDRRIVWSQPKSLLPALESFTQVACGAVYFSDSRPIQPLRNVAVRREWLKEGQPFAEPSQAGKSL